MIDPPAEDLGIVREKPGTPVKLSQGRLLDPKRAHLGRSCQTANGKLGTLKPLPPSPQFLYCAG
jgi:hypothetical protein